MGVRNFNRGFGQTLRFLREKARVQQKDLAEHLGISQTYLCEIEIGTRRPPDKHIINKMSSYLQLDPNRLIIASALAQKQFVLPTGKQHKNNLGCLLLEKWNSLSESQIFDMIKILTQKEES